MTRPIILGVVGDSGAGKTTITQGLVGILGEEQVTAVPTDDYHRYDRKERAERGITPLHPDCNYVDIIAQHLRLLRDGEPILKPVYQHDDGTFGPPVYVSPKPFTVVEGLLGYHSEEHARLLRRARVPRAARGAAPKVEARARLPLGADTRPTRCWRSSTGASPTPAQFIRPQERHADMVVSFRESRESGALRRRSTPSCSCATRCPTPTSRRSGTGPNAGSRSKRATSERRVKIAGDIAPEHADEIEEAIWEQLHFASHLRSARLGEFTVGHDTHRSESLALVQLLILYHLVTARAADALGGEMPRTEATTAG